MATIYRKTDKGVEVAGQAFAHGSTGLRPSDPTKERAKRKKQKARKAKAKQTKASKKAKLKALSKQRQNQRFMAHKVMSLGASSAKNAFEVLKHCSTRELLELRGIAEAKVKRLPQEKREPLLKVLSQIRKVENFFNSLELEQAHRDAGEVKGAISRRLTAKVVNKHHLGRVIGKVNVVEYGAPGSSTWATPRKRR